MPFDLLSAPIRKYIYNQGWEQLRNIQIAAIQRILTTDNHYILASPTASGKTEAAFLPILSKVDFCQLGVQVLYVSPLIALINDQFERIETLCQYLDVNVTKWHGEAKISAKNKLIKHPNGILLITPESLEAMFVNKPLNIKRFFSNLKFIVIDEVHAFIGSDRGVQLKSIISRLQLVNPSPFRIICLSATLGDNYSDAKRFTGNVEKTKVLVDKSKKELIVNFKYFQAEAKQKELPSALLEDLYSHTKNDKVLIFANSRKRTEEIAVRLKRISSNLKGHTNYFSHHSLVDKEIREDVESFAKSSVNQNFAIACTSTLELGIDIGSVNKIVQIDATYSVASLVQRIGRSGRRKNKPSQLLLYATDGYKLLQSLSCWLLYNEGFVDLPKSIFKPYNILVHQVLSITKQYSGLSINTLFDLVCNNFAFDYIEKHEVEEIIDYLINTGLLEKIQNDIIIGIEGEKLVNTWDFYGVFITEERFTIINSGKQIGELPFSSDLREGKNIVLAARLWKIKLIDFKSNKIEVAVTNDYEPPNFDTSFTPIHCKIRQKMLEILYSKENFNFLDIKSCLKLDELRRDFSIFGIKDLSKDRPLLIDEDGLEFFSFTGTQILNSIYFLFDIAKIKHSDSDCISFTINLSKQELLDKWNDLTQPLKSIDSYLEIFLAENPNIINFSKWGKYLPVKFQVSLLKQSYFDFDGAELFLTSCNIVSA